MDILLTWNNAIGQADISMAGADLAVGHDLETAVLISLFSDRTADADDVLPADAVADPRGWWADVYEAGRLGSKLWQVFGRVRNQDTLNFARDAATQALQWLIDDKVAATVKVAPSYYGSGGLRLDIAITQPNGTTNQYSYAWSEEP